MSFEKKTSFNLINRKKSVQINFFKKLRESKSLVWKIVLGGLASIFCVGVLRFYFAIVRELPDISKVDDIVFSQATTITDRNGKILYKLFQENREYVPIETVNKNMINAIIAVEDQNFWNNEGIDFFGMIRAFSSDLLQGNALRQGGSTITQQLVKNLLLTRDKTVTRKLKEIVLTMQIGDVIKKQIEVKNPGISSKELKQKMKEKILEMYLNYIFLGNNSYGVEAASKTYFASSSSGLTVLQAAILAGIPKAPSLYDPYKNRKILMGDLEVTQNGIEVVLTGDLKSMILNRVVSDVKAIDLNNKKDNQDFIKFIKGLAQFDMEFEGQIYSVKYTPGRKDSSLTRMYEESYIDQNQLKEAFVEGLTFQFKKATMSINAPHFVFYVIDQLKDKYDEEMLMKGGLTIKTTLDMDIQLLAEQSFKENEDNLKNYGANNASMVYLDSKNGDILSYIGALDYFNQEIDGNVDMVRALRQPGSSIKPLFYALGFMKLPLTLDTPIYDIPMKIGKDTPNNNDGQFEGILPLRKALAHSRNIPAIKMYFSVGEDAGAKEFLKKIGIGSLSDNVKYGYPLAIGGGEVKMIELANAYSHLSAQGKPAKLDPILEVRLPDGSLLYQKKVELQEQVIPAGVAYLLRKILSDNENLPASWISNFTVAGLKLATKSGTTDMKLANGQQLPRDGRLAIYTPSKVAMFWAGNTSGKPMRANAYGGWVNGKARKAFFKKLKDKGLIKNETVSPTEVGSVSISKISGKIATDDTPEEFVVSTVGYVKTLPATADLKMQYVEIDKACYGKKSVITPIEDVLRGYVITPTTFMPNGMDLNDIKQRFGKASRFGSGADVNTGGEVQYQYRNLFLEEPAEICEGRNISEDKSIALEVLKPLGDQDITKKFSVWYNISASRNIRYVKILLDEIEIGQKTYSSNKLSDIINVEAFKGIEPGEHYVVVMAIDDQGFSNKQTVKVNIQSTDNQPPVFQKDKIGLSRLPSGKYKVILFFSDDQSQVQGGTISAGGKQISSFESSLATFEMDELQEVTFTVKDIEGNKLTDKVDLTKYSQ